MNRYVTAIFLMSLIGTPAIGDDEFYAVAYHGQLFYMNATTGGTKSVHEHIGGQFSNAMAADSRGRLYTAGGVSSQGGRDIWVTNPWSGESKVFVTITGVPDDYAGNGVRGMAMTPDGSLYVLWYGPGGLPMLGRVDPTTGAFVEEESAPKNIPSTQNLASDSAGNLYFGSSSNFDNGLGKYNPVTGSYEFLDINFNGNQGLEITPEGTFYQVGDTGQIGVDGLARYDAVNDQRVWVATVDASLRGLALVVPSPAGFVTYFVWGAMLPSRRRRCAAREL